MKVLVGLNSKNIDEYLNYTNSFIIGIKDFSISYLDFSLDELKELRDKLISLGYNIKDTKDGMIVTKN